MMFQQIKKEIMSFISNPTELVADSQYQAFLASFSTLRASTANMLAGKTASEVDAYFASVTSLISSAQANLDATAQSNDLVQISQQLGFSSYGSFENVIISGKTNLDGLVGRLPQNSNISYGEMVASGFETGVPGEEPFEPISPPEPAATCDQKRTNCNRLVFAAYTGALVACAFIPFAPAAVLCAVAAYLAAEEGMTKCQYDYEDCIKKPAQHELDANKMLPTYWTHLII